MAWRRCHAGAPPGSLCYPVLGAISTFSCVRLPLLFVPRPAQNSRPYRSVAGPVRLGSHPLLAAGSPSRPPYPAQSLLSRPPEEVRRAHSSWPPVWHKAQRSPIAAIQRRQANGLRGWSDSWGHDPGWPDSLDFGSASMEWGSLRAIPWRHSARLSDGRGPADRRWRCARSPEN
jgi:hypothetical protein